MNKKEIPYFNYLKYYLMFFVVLGHCLDAYVSNPYFKGVYLFIYSFHMPVFIFIAGFFAKYDRKKILRYLYIFLILQAIHILIKVLITDRSTYSFVDILGFIITPQWTLWFLPALAVWLFTTKFIKKVKYWHILIAVLVTLVMGFVPFVGRVLTLSRIFYFYPIFLLGKMFGENKQGFVEKLKKIQSPLIQVVSLLFMMALFVFFTLNVASLPKGFFYGSDVYKNAFGILYRMISLLTGVIVGFAFMMTISINAKSAWGGDWTISQIGKRTLAVYVFHPLILIFVNEYAVLHNFSNFYTLLILCVLTFLIMLATSIPPLHELIVGKQKSQK